MTHKNTPTTKEDFLSHITKTNTGCWEWSGYFIDGYGSIRYEGGQWLAHRLSWKLHRGDMGDNHVLHVCDNRKCVNPEHLYLGNNDDNVRDRVRRNREADRRGVKNPRAKLTEDLVLGIRADNCSTNQELADIFGVSPQLISRIRLKQCWTHLNDPKG